LHSSFFVLYFPTQGWFLPSCVFESKSPIVNQCGISGTKAQNIFRNLKLGPEGGTGQHSQLQGDRDGKTAKGAKKA
jgi:hypothetical protein